MKNLLSSQKYVGSFFSKQTKRLMSLVLCNCMARVDILLATMKDLVGFFYKHVYIYIICTYVHTV